MAGVYYTRDIVSPVFLAITLVLTARPMVRWLNARGVPRVLSAFIGMVPPAIIALLDQGWETMVLLLICYTAVNFTSDMLIQPKVTGDAVGLNITATFVSLLFWSLLLGPMGAILAVPLTLFFKCILLDAESRTRWMSIFLGGDLDGLTPGSAAPTEEAPSATDDAPSEPDAEAPLETDGAAADPEAGTPDRPAEQGRGESPSS